MSAAAETEDLGQIGEGMCNDYLLRPVNEMNGDGMPPGGFVGKLSRAAQVGKLREQLAERLGVPLDGLSFAFEGKELLDDRTIGENGITEPGPAARRRGTKVGITFMLKRGVELSATVQRRTLEREVQQAAEEEKKRNEEAAREAIASRARAEEDAKLKIEADAQAAAAASAREAAKEADRLTVRCAPLGTSGGRAVITTRSTTVAQLGTQVQEEMGMRGEPGSGLCFTFNGNVLVERATLRESGIEEDSELYYYWVGAD